MRPYVSMSWEIGELTEMRQLQKIERIWLNWLQMQSARERLAFQPAERLTIELLPASTRQH